jgi:hypothetical protein
MKPNDVSRVRGRAEAGGAFRGACRASGQKVLAQVARAKAAVFAEYSHALRSQERLLRLALNEAEAVARQTTYPHLVFPTLAAEKAQAVIAWNRRQESVRRANPVLVLAA